VAAIVKREEARIDLASIPPYGSTLIPHRLPHWANLRRSIRQLDVVGQTGLEALDEDEPRTKYATYPGRSLAPSRAHALSREMITLQPQEQSVRTRLTAGVG
jgi:hypothetical protein